MKKVLCIVVTLAALLLGLVACGQKETKDSERKEPLFTKIVSNDFDESTNIKVEEKGLSFQIPSSWNDRNTSNDEKYVYYYPEDGILMVYENPLSFSTSMTDSFADGFIKGIENNAKDFKLVDKEVVLKDYKDLQKYTLFVNYTANISGRDMRFCAVTFIDDKSEKIIVYGDFLNSRYTRMDDFKKIIDTIEILNPDCASDSLDNPNEKDDNQEEVIKDSPTLREQKATIAALEYLSIMGVSRKNLIELLKLDGFSESEAIYGVDHSHADWEYQAWKVAKDYLNLMSFTESDLISQLEYEGFTRSQAEYAVNQVK